jgi:uncharacterized protein YndB with AHSA1/START domain
MPAPLTVTTPSDREVVITRRFDAPRELVFRAFTEPALVRRWLLGPAGWTMPVCDIDLRVGGKYRYLWKNADGGEMGLTGIIRELAPPERLVSTEVFDADWTGGETRSSIVLTGDARGTTLTQTVVYGSQAARDGAISTGMAVGMEAGYARLDDLLMATAG